MDTKNQKKFGGYFGGSLCRLAFAQKISDSSGNPMLNFTRHLRDALIAGLFLLGTSGFTAQTYFPPANSRADFLLDDGWRFIRQDVQGAEAADFNDATWSAIQLPHTWNNLDGQDGGNNYYRGIGWYRLHYTAPASCAGRELFLKFDAAFLIADVWVNGHFLGEHRGGFAAFTFDVTPWLKPGADNVIAVKVNNARNADVPTLWGDFTMCGGLTRDVHLLATDRLHISPLDFGSPGVYLKTTDVNSHSARLQISTVVSNAGAMSATVTVRVVVVDAKTNIVKELACAVELPSAAGSNVVLQTKIARPHLWNGLADPYLYRAYVEIYDGTNLADVVAQPLGFRWFSVSPSAGFFLNGRHYDLHGVNLHEFWLDRGWAITSDQREARFALLKELGATFVRLCHYQHGDEDYRLADRDGIVAWSELAMVDSFTASSNFTANARQQLQEMIRQDYNHPSICFWSLFNEQNKTSFTNLLAPLNDLAHAEDPTRLTTAASHQADDNPMNFYTDVIGQNRYFGWYGGDPGEFAQWADQIHSRFPDRSIGLSEYGAGASIFQHEDNPTNPVPNGVWHPEEWQNLQHETYWQALAARPWFWCKLIWVLYDFPSDGRKEGDTPGRNDKGLVTIDGHTRKDAFYYYQANWTTQPMVYITGHTFTNRPARSITAKVYANCSSVELLLNGVSQGSRTSTNHIFTWPLTLATGTNVVQAVGRAGRHHVTDNLVWMAE
jgi:beta-galactosidase